MKKEKQKRYRKVEWYAVVEWYCPYCSEYNHEDGRDYLEENEIIICRYCDREFKAKEEE